MDIDKIKKTIVNNLSYLQENKQDIITRWNEIYVNYRLKPKTSDIQTQSTIIPLTKYSIRTIMKDLSYVPEFRFKTLDNDEEKDIFLNEFYNQVVLKDNKFAKVKSIIDKKQELLFGRTFMKLNIKDGKVKIENIDPFDMLVSEDVDPANLDEATFIAQTNIYRRLSEVLENELFDEEAKRKIAGADKLQVKTKELLEKAERKRELGYNEHFDLESTEKDPFINLTEIYFKTNLRGENEFFYIIFGGDEVLYIQPLEDLIGKTRSKFWQDHTPFVSWADDVETDFWSDGVGEILRIPQKVLNAWFSQLIENRTLKNLGMFFYNSTLDWSPDFIEPRAFGFYSFPGDPNQNLRQIQIPDLQNSIQEMNFLMNLTERATATTITQQGDVNKQKVTLGEIQLALEEAKKRTFSITTFSTEAYRELAYKFCMLAEAGAGSLDPVKITKRGRFSDKIYSKKIKPKDFISKLGYEVEIIEIDPVKDSENLQKLSFAKSLMPENKKLSEIIKRKALEFSNLTNKEIKEVMDEEEAMLQATQQPQLAQQPQLTEGQNLQNQLLVNQ